jgi:hypothetical protein
MKRILLLLNFGLGQVTSLVIKLDFISQLSSMPTLPLQHMQQCQVDWNIPLYLFAPLFGSKSMLKEKIFVVWGLNLGPFSHDPSASINRPQPIAL